jgi:uncharacterized membrane protein
MKRIIIVALFLTLFSGCISNDELTVKIYITPAPGNHTETLQIYSDNTWIGKIYQNAKTPEVGYSGIYREDKTQYMLILPSGTVWFATKAGRNITLDNRLWVRS